MSKSDGETDTDDNQKWWSRDYGDAAERRSSFALRATEESTIEAIKRLEPPSRVRYGALGALLEYAVMHGDEAEAERIREELRKLTDGV